MHAPVRGPLISMSTCGQIGLCLNLHNSIGNLHNFLEDSHKVVGQGVWCRDGIEK